MEMRKILLFLALPLMAMACSRQQAEKPVETIDTTPSLIMQIRKCSRMYSAEYKVHKIVTHDDQMKLNGSFLQKDFSIDLPLGKRKVAIPINATLKAYIDFGDISEKNFRRKGRKIEVILPDPQVVMTSSKIRHQDIKQYVSVLRSDFSDEELTRFEQQGRKAIINDIPRLGIIATARENAAHTLIPIIQQMGYREEDITISFRKDFSIDDIRTLLDKSVEHATSRK